MNVIYYLRTFLFKTGRPSEICIRGLSSFGSKGCVNQTHKVALLMTYGFVLGIPSGHAEGLADGNAAGHALATVAAASPASTTIATTESVTNQNTVAASAEKDAVVLKQWCDQVRTAMRNFHWKKLEPCEGIDWKIGGQSVEGRPLVYGEFGEANHPNTTVVFSMVHGDENTPLYTGFALAQWLREHSSSLKGVRVVVVPLVNVDGFFSTPRRRVNSNGVDVNRNFQTSDWSKSAIASWKKKFRSDPRRFPGKIARSEPETVFQEDMIHKFKPKKILSVHSPLNFTDYDGPDALKLDRFSADYVKFCGDLKQRLRAKAGGFFPGSLGNFAGQEIGIPTITLELPTADSGRAYQYWLKFKPGIQSMIEFNLPDPTTANAIDREIR